MSSTIPDSLYLLTVCPPDASHYVRCCPFRNKIRHSGPALSVPSNAKFTSAFFIVMLLMHLSQDQSAVCNAFKQQYLLTVCPPDASHYV